MSSRVAAGRSKIPVWLDCDPGQLTERLALAAVSSRPTLGVVTLVVHCVRSWPGHDDALAILLAGHHPDVQLLGISTVASNQVRQCGAWGTQSRPGHKAAHTL